MKVWVSHASDSYGVVSEISLFKKYKDAVDAGLNIMQKEHMQSEHYLAKFDVIENYNGRIGETRIVIHKEEGQFFPGDVEVIIRELEVQ